MKKNFTLVETIVVLGVISLFLPLFFNIIFIITREQMKINSLIIVKREGDYLINSISNLVRNYAFYIHSSDPPSEQNLVCDQNNNYSSNTQLTFRTKDNHWFRIFLNNDKIASYSSSQNTTFNLNSDKTRIYNFSINCDNSSFFSFPIVNIGFDICYKGTDSQCSLTNEEFVNLRYQTRIKLRNR